MSAGPLDRCESPIEKQIIQRMYREKWTAPSEEIGKFIESSFDIRACECLERRTVVCMPQMPFGPYRCDFVIFVFTHDFLPLVIEADGHEFHEKTKEQAQRDKARDRYAIEHGCQVARFTGSEIHRSHGAVVTSSIWAWAFTQFTRLPPDVPNVFSAAYMTAVSELIDRGLLEGGTLITPK